MNNNEQQPRPSLPQEVTHEMAEVINQMVLNFIGTAIQDLLEKIPGNISSEILNNPQIQDLMAQVEEFSTQLDKVGHKKNKDPLSNKKLSALLLEVNGFIRQDLSQLTAKQQEEAIKTILTKITTTSNNQQVKQVIDDMGKENSNSTVNGHAKGGAGAGGAGAGGAGAGGAGAGGAGATKSPSSVPLFNGMGRAALQTTQQAAASAANSARTAQIAADSAAARAGTGVGKDGARASNGQRSPVQLGSLSEALGAAGGEGGGEDEALDIPLQAAPQAAATASLAARAAVFLAAGGAGGAAGVGEVGGAIAAATVAVAIAAAARTKATDVAKRSYVNCTILFSLPVAAVTYIIFSMVIAKAQTKQVTVAIGGDLYPCPKRQNDNNIYDCSDISYNHQNLQAFIKVRTTTAGDHGYSSCKINDKKVSCDGLVDNANGHLYKLPQTPGSYSFTANWVTEYDLIKQSLRLTFNRNNNPAQLQLRNATSITNETRSGPNQTLGSLYDPTAFITHDPRDTNQSYAFKFKVTTNTGELVCSSSAPMGSATSIYNQLQNAACDNVDQYSYYNNLTLNVSISEGCIGPDGITACGESNAYSTIYLNFIPAPQMFLTKHTVIPLLAKDADPTPLLDKFEIDIKDNTPANLTLTIPGLSPTQQEGVIITSSDNKGNLTSITTEEPIEFDTKYDLENFVRSIQISTDGSIPQDGDTTQNFDVVIKVTQGRKQASDTVQFRGASDNYNPDQALRINIKGDAPQETRATQTGGTGKIFANSSVAISTTDQTNPVKITIDITSSNQPSQKINHAIKLANNTQTITPGLAYSFNSTAQAQQFINSITYDITENMGPTGQENRINFKISAAQAETTVVKYSGEIIITELPLQNLITHQTCPENPEAITHTNTSSKLKSKVCGEFPKNSGNPFDNITITFQVNSSLPGSNTPLTPPALRLTSIDNNTKQVTPQLTTTGVNTRYSYTDTLNQINRLELSCLFNLKALATCNIPVGSNFSIITQAAIYGLDYYKQFPAQTSIVTIVAPELAIVSDRSYIFPKHNKSLSLPDTLGIQVTGACQETILKIECNIPEISNLKFALDFNKTQHPNIIVNYQGGITQVSGPSAEAINDMLQDPASHYTVTSSTVKPNPGTLFLYLHNNATDKTQQNINTSIPMRTY